MPLSVVGFGSWDAANNAAVSPGLPSGMEAGDLMLAFVSIKENGAGIGGFTGWTYRGDAAGTNVEARIAVFTRVYQVGDGGPTFSVTGGGANDTVLGVIVALRGSTSFLNVSTSIENDLGNTVSIPYFGPINPGDFILSSAFKTNDSAAAPARSMSGATNMGASYFSSLLGSDATADITVWRSDTITVPLGSGGANGSIAFDGTGDSSFCITATVRRPFEITGSGGVVTGGSASAVFIPKGTNFAPVPTGPAVVGGSAQTSMAVSPGARFRVKGSMATKTGSGSMNVVIPATAQVGDLLLIYLGCRMYSDSHVYPSVPTGWTYALGETTGQNGFTSGMVCWKKCEAGDPGSSVSVSYLNDDGASQLHSKAGMIIAYYNVDFANGPIKGVSAVSTAGSSDSLLVTKKVTTTWPQVLSVSVNFLGGSLTAATLATACTDDGWIERHDSKPLTSPFSGLLFWIGERVSLGGIPADVTCNSTVSSSNNYTRLWFGIAGLNIVTVAPDPVGGAIVGGAGNYLPPGGDPNNWVASGGVLAVGEAVCSLLPKLFHYAYGINPIWNSQGLTEGIISGWNLKVYIDDIEYPCTQMTVRRKGSELSVTLKLVGNLILFAGAIIDVVITYNIPGQPAATQTLFSTVLDESRSGSGFTYIEGFSGGQVSYGAAFVPDKTLVISPSMTRVPINWQVRPGDLFDGVVIQEVVTTLGTDSNWFTEVRYGKG